MKRRYVRCIHCHRVVYRMPYVRHSNGRLDTHESPVWLLAEENVPDSKVDGQVVCGCALGGGAIEFAGKWRGRRKLRKIVIGIFFISALAFPIVVIYYLVRGEVFSEAFWGATKVSLAPFSLPLVFNVFYLVHWLAHSIKSAALTVYGRLRYGNSPPIGWWRWGPPIQWTQARRELADFWTVEVGFGTQDE